MPEETPPISDIEHPHPEKPVRQAQDAWYTPLARVTPLSKALAMGLFILLPFVGFVVGVGYGKDMDMGDGRILSKISRENTVVHEVYNDTLQSVGDSGSVTWLPYTDEDLGLSFEYPSHYQLKKDANGDIRMEYAPKHANEIEDWAFISIGRSVGLNHQTLSVEELYDEDTALHSYSSVASREVIRIGPHTAVRMGIPHIGTEYAIYIADGFDIINVAYRDVAPQYMSDYEDIVRSLCFNSEKLTDSCWEHHTIHGESMDGKTGLFHVMTPSSWVMRTHPAGIGTGDSWWLQSTSFEHNIHGIGVPRSGSMWIRIGGAICDPTQVGVEPAYESVTDEGDKFASVKEKTICSDGYKIVAGIWVDDPDYDLHTQILDDVLYSFRVDEDVAR